MDDTELVKQLVEKTSASMWERQKIPVITVTEPGKWDLSESDKEKILREIAEAAIELAERAGADSEEVETLSMLLESIK